MIGMPFVRQARISLMLGSGAPAAVCSPSTVTKLGEPSPLRPTVEVPRGLVGCVNPVAASRQLIGSSAAF